MTKDGTCPIPFSIFTKWVNESVQTKGPVRKRPLSLRNSVCLHVHGRTNTQLRLNQYEEQATGTRVDQSDLSLGPLQRVSCELPFVPSDALPLEAVTVCRSWIFG